MDTKTQNFLQELDANEAIQLALKAKIRKMIEDGDLGVVEYSVGEDDERLASEKTS